MKTSKKSLISAKNAVAGLSGAALLAAVNVAQAGGDFPSAYQISVPEPSALSLMAGGLATAVLIARVRRNKKK
jgi:hypothetical protein